MQKKAMKKNIRTHSKSRFDDDDEEEEKEDDCNLIHPNLKLKDTNQYK